MAFGTGLEFAVTVILFCVPSICHLCLYGADSGYMDAHCFANGSQLRQLPAAPHCLRAVVRVERRCCTYKIVPPAHLSRSGGLDDEMQMKVAAAFKTGRSSLRLFYHRLFM